MLVVVAQNKEEEDDDDVRDVFQCGGAGQEENSTHTHTLAHTVRCY